MNKTKDGQKKENNKDVSNDKVLSKTVSGTPNNSDTDSVDENSKSEDEVGKSDFKQGEWLKSLINKEVNPCGSRSKSKLPIKTAKQSHPFVCSECGLKYKSNAFYKKHMNMKHPDM